MWHNCFHRVSSVPCVSAWQQHVYCHWAPKSYQLLYFCSEHYLEKFDVYHFYCVWTFSSSSWVTALLLVGPCRFGKWNLGYSDCYWLAVASRVCYITSPYQCHSVYYFVLLILRHNRTGRRSRRRFSASCVLQLSHVNGTACTNRARC